MKNINVPFVSNDLLNIKVEKYCAILGSNPSKGARSPLLWNKCFETMNLPYYFFPFDVEKSRLGKLIDYLRSDDSFLGGAVAVPHKEIIIDFLDEVEEEAKIIGAVNLIYRKKNKLIGANTDGLGGISSLADYMNLDLDNFASGKIATVVGTGGAAKAIAVYLSKAIGKSGKIFIAGRNQDKLIHLEKKCSNFTSSESVLLDDSANAFSLSDIVINCSAVGYENNYVKNESNHYLEPFLPLALTPAKGFANSLNKHDWLLDNIDILKENYKKSLSIISKFKKNTIVMDAVYQPEETFFLKVCNALGHSTLSGKKMNLLQAVYGFEKAIESKYENRDIFNIMSKVK